MTNATPQATAPDEGRWRLPRALRPSRYEIHLIPDLEAHTFTGKVTISCDVTESSSEIVLNAAELTIDKAVVEAGGKQVSVSGTSVDEESERLTLGLGESLAAGSTLSIYIEFTGFLNDQLRGFYRSVFTPPGAPEGTAFKIRLVDGNARRACRWTRSEWWRSSRSCPRACPEA